MTAEHGSLCGIVVGVVQRSLVDEDKWTVAFLAGSQVTDGNVCDRDDVGSGD
jgi:hypothetical protein